jgi:hypothetical protein
VQAVANGDVREHNGSVPYVRLEDAELRRIREAGRQDLVCRDIDTASVRFDRRRFENLQVGKMVIDLKGDWPSAPTTASERIATSTVETVSRSSPDIAVVAIDRRRENGASSAKPGVMRRDVRKVATM